MNVFTDSSALAKRYIADERSSSLDEILQSATNLAVSVLCISEIISALCRRRRERFLKPADYARAKTALEADLADATWSSRSLMKYCSKAFGFLNSTHYVHRTRFRYQALSFGARTGSFPPTLANASRPRRAGFRW